MERDRWHGAEGSANGTEFSKFAAGPMGANMTVGDVQEITQYQIPCRRTCRKASQDAKRGLANLEADS